MVACINKKKRKERKRNAAFDKIIISLSKGFQMNLLIEIFWLGYPRSVRLDLVSINTKPIQANGQRGLS